MILPADMIEGFRAAKCPEDIFGTDLKANFRRLAAITHPDTVNPEDRDEATEIFALITDWKAKADLKVDAGTYGDRRPVKPPKPPYSESTLKIGRRNLTLVSELGSDAFARVHEAKIEGDKTGGQFALKIARSPRDNDLLEREYRALQLIASEDPNPNREAFFKERRAYFPHPVQTFQVAGAGRAKHRANLLAFQPQRHLTAESLREDHFPLGVPLDHAYWIFRRLLLTVWVAHLKGIAHGALTPDHVLVFPKEHGIVLIDWTASAKLGIEHVPLINDRWKGLYPPEVAKKAKATPTIDIFMAAATCVDIAGGPAHFKRTAPTEVADSLLTHCMNPDPSRRPKDAEKFYSEFERLIEKHHGPRKFVALEV